MNRIERMEAPPERYQSLRRLCFLRGSLKNWLPRLDSNQDTQSQSLVSYHWTTGQKNLWHSAVRNVEAPRGGCERIIIRMRAQIQAARRIL